MKSYPIIIDPEFKALCPPLSADERVRLKASIKEYDGLLDKISLWHQGNGVHVLIDGHHRYDIIKELAESEDLEERIMWANRWRDIGTSYCLVRLDGDTDREAVKLWILEHQIARRNLDKNSEDYITMVARIVVLRQEQTRKVSKANLKQGSAAPDVTETVPSGKRTVTTATKEFQVPREPLQAAVNKEKGKLPVTKKAAPPKTAVTDIPPSDLFPRLEKIFGEGQVKLEMTVITRFGKTAVCPQHRYGRTKVSLLMTDKEIDDMCSILDAAISKAANAPTPVQPAEAT